MRLSRRPNKGYGDHEIERFNREVPEGARIRYWPVLPFNPKMDGTLPDYARPIETATRSAAWALGHGDGVVLIDGQAGGVAISHVEVLP